MKRKHVSPRLVIERKLNSILRKKPKDINPKLLKTGIDLSLAISQIRLEKNMITKEEFNDDLVSQMLDTADMIEKSAGYLGNVKPVVVKL